ncbi:MAG: hypothetical protein K1X75_08380 [Leptospirales bacterium]|nr:hypothetical protein [Leptospirales bacterium]
MKQWQPEESFEKADFPSRKRQKQDAAPPAWRPELDFERADFPRPATPAQTPSAESPPAAGNDSGGSRSIRRWLPGKTSEASPARAIDAGQVLGGGKASAASPAGGDGAGVQNRLLQEAALTRREEARHVLRRWYWEKAGQAQGTLAAIDPHDRIAIVLNLLGADVARRLLELFSPMERQQVLSVLRRPMRRYAVNELALVRAGFMEALRTPDPQ